MQIVVGIDGSPSSIEAHDLVASLRWPKGTSITLVSALGLPTLWVGDATMAGGEWLAAAADGLRADAEEHLVRLAEPLEGRGWGIERRVVQGRAASVILETARDTAADVVVVGSRGHGPIVSMLLGSVSAEVAEQADCSVLVARSSQVERLLVATDGSECSGVIPDELAKWGVFADLPATCLSVTPVDSPAFALMVDLYTMHADPLEAQRAELAEAHRGYAATLTQRLAGAGISAVAEVRSGDAAHEIIEAGVVHRADLIVTGSRCLHGLDRWLLGSVARNVLLHTKASVLIVRDRERPAAS